MANGTVLTAATTGVATGPTALTNIATLTVAPGTTYEITAQLYFSGTTPVDGTDSDNWVLQVDGTTSGKLGIPATAGVASTVKMIGTTGTGGSITIQNFGAATAGTKYHASLVVNQVGNPGVAPFYLQPTASV